MLFLVLAIAASPGLKSALTGDEMKFLNNPESVKGQTLLNQEMGGMSDVSETVLVHSDTLTVDDSAFQQRVEGVAAALLAEQGSVAQAFTYYQASLFAPEAAGSMVSADRHTTLIPVSFAGGAADNGDTMNEYLATVRAQNTDQFDGGDGR